MKVNGKEYPFWGQFVERKEEFIGRTLEDYDMGMSASTVVTDITLEENGKESAYFSIHGKDFSCGFDVRHGGISGKKTTEEADAIVFSGYGGHKFIVGPKVDSNDG